MIGSPKPPAPINAASVAVPILITALVLIPERIERDAIGRYIFQRRAIGLSPNATADSRNARGMSCEPVAVLRTIGSKPYRNSAATAVRRLIPKKGRGTSKASNASDGIVCTTPAKQRIDRKSVV